MYQCFVCDQMFESGERPGVYGGRPVQGWGKEMICNRCSKLDGIVPTPELENKLRAKGINIEYNDKGWIVIPA